MQRGDKTMKEYIKTIALSVFLLIVVAAGVGTFVWSYKFDKYCYELGCKGDFNVNHFIALQDSYQAGLKIYMAENVGDMKK